MIDIKNLKTLPGYEEVKYENKKGEYFGQMALSQTVIFRAPHFEKTFVKVREGLGVIKY